MSMEIEDRLTSFFYKLSSSNRYLTDNKQFNTYINSLEWGIS